MMRIPAARCTLNFTPVSVFRYLYRSGGWGLAVQNILDLLPELLFFLQVSPSD